MTVRGGRGGAMNILTHQEALFVCYNDCNNLDARAVLQIPSGVSPKEQL
jgi:hypothetical protein